jgi:hypothetical protein
MKKARVFVGLVAIGLTGFMAFVPVSDEPTVVTVTGGQIAGTVSKDGAVRSFKGIPFAAPPVGTLRWKAPQPVKPWQGVRKGDQFGPSPMQGTPAPFGPWSAEYLIPKAPISEDCLYLNRKSACHRSACRYSSGYTAEGSTAGAVVSRCTTAKPRQKRELCLSVRTTAWGHSASWHSRN